MKDDDERAGAADDPPVGNRRGGRGEHLRGDPSGGTEGRRGEHLHAATTRGQGAACDPLDLGQGRQSGGHQEALKRQSDPISDSLDLGARRRREQRVQVRQLLTQQHLWVGRGAVMSACMQGRARKIVALTLPHLEVLIKGDQEAIKRSSEIISEIAPRGSRASACRRRAAWRPLRPPPSSRLQELTKLTKLTKLGRRTRQWWARRRHVPTPPRAAGRRAR